MKATGLVLLVIAYLILINGPSYAVPSETRPQSSSETSASAAIDRLPGAERPYQPNKEKHQTAKQQRDWGHISGATRPANLAKVNRAKQLPNDRQHFLSGNASALRQPGGSSVGTAGKEDVSVKQPGSHRTRPTPALGAIRSGQSSNSVRHRGLNPPVIGGLSHSGAGNTSGINGASISRRP